MLRLRGNPSWRLRHVIGLEPVVAAAVIAAISHDTPDRRNSFCHYAKRRRFACCVETLRRSENTGILFEAAHALA